MIVIDVGCATYGGTRSIERLIDEYAPELLYGFDPNVKGLEDAMPRVVKVSPPGGTYIFHASAAWIYDGEIGYVEDGFGWTTTDERPDARKVRCFDLAAFILSLPDTHGPSEIVLKLDCEGAEYDVLDHVMDTGADTLLTVARVEWHSFGVPDPDVRRRNIEAEFACPIEEWRL